METNENRSDFKEESPETDVSSSPSATEDRSADSSKGISEEERMQVRHRTNVRIAHACCYAALIIVLIDFAAYVIGQADWFFMPVGIMLSIALLAIAMLNNPIDSGSKKK